MRKHINTFFIVLVIALSMVVVGCSRKMLPPAEIETTITDSVREKEVIKYRDTVIKLPGDTIGIRIPCPEVKDTVIRKGKTSLSVKNDGKGNVTVNCATDSLNLIIDSLKEVIKEKERFRTVTRSEKIPYAVKVIKYKVPKWCRYLLIANILYLVWKFRKPILSLIKKIV